MHRLNRSNLHHLVLPALFAITSHSISADIVHLDTHDDIPTNPQTVHQSIKMPSPPPQTAPASLSLSPSPLQTLNSIKRVSPQCKNPFFPHNHKPNPNFLTPAITSVTPSVVNLSVSMGLHAKHFPIGINALSGGSGFIITDSGLVVTNAHVVMPSLGVLKQADTTIYATTSDGVHHPARIHSVDLKSDLALLQLITPHTTPPAKFHAATLGSSSAMNVGDFVVALGSPLMLKNSATFGIVSSKFRNGDDIFLGGQQKGNMEMDYIQTDAAINAGNSGGPLINLSGHVIGINTIKTRNTEGISFAQSIDTLLPFITQLVLHGEVKRPFLGIKIVAVDEYSEDSFGDSGGEGDVGSNLSRRNDTDHNKSTTTPTPTPTPATRVKITYVKPNSPAFKAGLKTNDTILEFNGKPVFSTDDVVNGIGLDMDFVYSVKVERDGERKGKECEVLEVKFLAETLVDDE